ncbi:hypothetical protein RCL1_001302 [Eukaryota sp. TZLM3-RCL]
MFVSWSFFQHFCSSISQSFLIKNSSYKEISRLYQCKLQSSAKLYVIDVVTIAVCKLSAAKNSLSGVSPLFDVESRKFFNYNVALSSLKCVSHVKYELRPFAISLYASVGRCALSILDDFFILVSIRHKKLFDFTLWRNRLVFTIFKHVPTMIDRSLEAVSLDDRAVTRIADQGNYLLS